MTGFARVNGQHEQCSWLWELKSLNSKGLDIRLRVPTSFDGLEQCVREQTVKALTRGNVTISLTVEWAQTPGAFQLNQDILDLVILSIPELEARIPNPSPTSAADVLALRGVIETFEQEVTDQHKTEIQSLILADFDHAIEALKEMRSLRNPMLLIKKLPVGVIPSPSPTFSAIPLRPIATGKVYPINLAPQWVTTRS